MQPPANYARDIQWLPFRNDSGEEIPARGILRPTGWVEINDGIVLTVGKPNANSAENHAVNSNATVADGQYGICTFSPVCLALYDTGDGTPAADEAWGTENASWQLHKTKTGFSAIATVDGRALFRRATVAASGSGEWTDTGTLLHPADLSGAEDVAIGLTAALDAARLSVTKAGVAYSFRNSTDAAANQVGIIHGNTRATGADDDSAYHSFHLCDNLGVSNEFARLTVAGQAVTSPSYNGRIKLSVVSSGSMTDQLTIDASKINTPAGLPVRLGTANQIDSETYALTAAATNVLTVENTTDGASNQIAILRGNDRATAADNDEAYVSLKLDDSAGNAGEFARLTWVASDVTAGTKDGKIEFAVVVNDVLTTVGTIDSTGFVGATDSDAIHDNVASEISAITEKTTPVSADLLIIEDSADSNNKKRVQIGNLPSDTSDNPVVQASEEHATNLTTSYADFVLDTTDVENDATVVEHDNTNTDRITLKETGLYKLTVRVEYDPPTSDEYHYKVYARLRVNDTTVVARSEMCNEIQRDSGLQGNRTTGAILAGTVYYSATANDYITLQVKQEDQGGSDTVTIQTRAGGVVVTAERCKIGGGSGGGGGSPAGSDTHVQFNDGGSFGGEAGLVYVKATDELRSGGTAAWRVPVGTTAQRPGTPGDGDLRVNTTTGNYEGYRSSDWRNLEGGGSSPLSAKGQVYTHDGTVDAALAVGSNGQVLTADSAETTGLKWSTLGSGGVQAGDCIVHAGASVPAGYLDCDGAEVSRSTYSALFSAIGTAYGAGDGSTTFNVPDFRGRAVLGVGQGSGLTNRARGDTPGVETHALSSAELASHTHSGPSHTHSLNSHTHTMPTHTHDSSIAAGTWGYTGGASIRSVTASGPNVATVDPGDTNAASGNTGSGGTGSTGSAGSGSAHQNMPPSGVAYWCIKT